MTIRDIARESGYAVSTVSRALNNHPGVSKEAKEKIARIVAAHGFVPNSNATQLKRNRSDEVVLMVKDGTKNLFLASVVEPIQRGVEQAGYQAAAVYLDHGADEVCEAERVLREHKPRGFVFIGGPVENTPERLAHFGVPCVLATAHAKGLRSPNLSTVGVDDAACAARAVEYLCACGHRDIAVIGGDPMRSHTSSERLAGCREALAARGLALRQERIAIGDYSCEGGFRAMRELLARDSLPSAVFCMCDSMAIGAIRALCDAGLQVPEDMSVIGIDGIELGRYCVPKLTTIVQPQQEIAEACVELLISILERGAPAEARIVGAELFEGESVRRL